MSDVLNPPFLELALYVGEANIEAAIHKLLPDQPCTIGGRPIAVRILFGLSSGPEEIAVGRGIIILRTEGEPFCGPFRRDTKRLRTLGRRVYSRMVQVLDVVAPAYGAILLEYSLEEPSELRRDPRSLAFQNFFLSTSHFDRRAIDEVLEIAGVDAYVERLNAGVYVSMSAEFNPETRHIPPLEAQRRSARIGSVIAKSLRNSATPLGNC